MKNLIFIAAPLLGWFSAQGIKFVFSLRKDGVTVTDAFQSGGMPSSHASFIIALTTVIGFSEGLDSAIFGLSLAVSAIIMYDARGVRLATGQQTEAIKNLANKHKIKVNITNAKGHRIIEVIAGAALGFVVGCLTYLVFSD